jgi:lipid A 3-O-deacylase
MACRSYFVAAAALALAAGPACAGEVLLGVYQHDIMDGISHGGHFEHGKDIVFGYRTASLDELSAIWSPHVHLIAGVNTLGGTDFVAAGFDWRIKFGPDDRFYFEPGIGAAIHTGDVNLASPDDPGLTQAQIDQRLNDFRTKLDLGSRVLFEPELALGWKATDRWSLEMSWIHMSHAQLAGPQNPGLGDFGFRAVYRFGADRGSSDTASASDDAPPRGRFPVNRLADAASSDASTPEGRLPVNRSVDAASSDASALEGRLPVNRPQGPASAAPVAADPPVLRGEKLPASPSPTPQALSVLLAPAAAANGEGGVVQVAAVGTSEGAQRALDGLKATTAAWPIPPDGRIEKSVVGGAVVYRALLDGFDDTRSAESFCAALRSAGQACFVRAAAKARRAGSAD